MRYALLFAFVLTALCSQPAQALDFFKRKPPQKEELQAPEPLPEKKAAAPKAKLPPFKEFEDPAIGEMKEYVTAAEDTLVLLSRDYDIGFVEMRAANPGIDPWVPGAGVKLVIPTQYILPDAPRRGIVINLPEMRLYYYGKPETAPESYPLGVGREGLSTPVGSTAVVSKVEGPTWHPTKRMREEDPELPEFVPPGPDNPLGTHALYLGWSEYRIHGTNKPFGIGRRSSSGCIRMYPEDIVKLWPEVPVGTPVTVVNQPVKAAWIGNEFFIEAHPTIEQANGVEESGAAPRYEMSEKDMKEILKAAGKNADLLNWDKIRTIIRTRNGYPVSAATRPGQS